MSIGRGPNDGRGQGFDMQFVDFTGKRFAKQSYRALLYQGTTLVEA